jgi:PAS domain S-box-containing protein
MGSSFVLIALFMGFLLLAFVVWWIYSRERAESSGIDEVMRRANEDNGTNSNAAVLITNEFGALLHVNPLLSEWLKLKGIEPDLEDISKQVQPVDGFLEMLNSEAQSSFQIGNRWVDASSHRVPTQNGSRMVVVMRELKHGQGSAANDDGTAMDVSTTISIVNEIGETVNAGMGVELALQMLLEILNKALPSDAGEICMWEAPRSYLSQRGWIGDTRYLLTVAAQGGGYEQGQGFAGWMAEHNKPLLINGRNDRVNANVLMKDNPYTSAVGVPMWLGQDFVGTVSLFSNDQGRYKPEDVSLLQAVSKAIGQAIRNAELYAKQEDRIRDIASLQQIAEQPKGERDAAPIYALLNERMAKLLDADMCGVLLYEENRNALVPQLPFYGLPDNVADKIIIPMPPNSPQFEIWRHQPYWVSNDVRDEPLVETLNFGPLISVAGISNTALFPMQIAGERIGIMAISNKRSEGGFMPNDIQNLRVLSSQAAIVVENVRLYQRERRIDTELVGLQEMTHAIGALSHEGEFYQEISERIARLMQSNMCGVLLYDSKRQALVSQIPFFGISDELVKDYAIELRSGSVMEQLWSEETSWFSNQVQTDTLVYEANLDELASKAGVSKTLMAVMSAGGRRIGIVQVSNKHAGADFDDKDARLLTIFATQAGAIIENARLFREVQVRAEQADRLRHIAELASSLISSDESYSPVLEEIAKLTNSKSVYINVVDYNTNTLVTQPRWVYGIDLNEKMIQDLTQPGYETIPARSGKFFSSNNVVKDSRLHAGYKRVAQRFGLDSLAIVPLSVGDKLIGELGVGNRIEGKYGDEDMTSFRAVAVQIASSVERLLLFEATDENLRRRVEELDSIARVSNELTLTTELDKILEVIRSEAAKTTYADAATVVVLRPSTEWINPEKPELDRRIGEIEGLVGFANIEEQALELGAEPIFVHDYEANGVKAAPKDARSAAAAPIIYLDQIVGVIHVYDKKPNAFDDRAAPFLMTLATKASLAYQNSVLYVQQRERGERLRQRVDQLNRIFELGQMVQSTTEPAFVLEAIAYSVQQSVGYDTIMMMLIDEETGELKRVTHAGMPIDAFNSVKNVGISREELDNLLKPEFQNGESYFFPVQELDKWYTDAVPAVSSAFDDNRSMNPRGKSWWHDGDLLLVTIVGQGGNLLGLMSLDRPYDNKRPERGSLEVLEIFAHQASAMLENTRLFRESQRSAEQEAKLNNTMEAIQGTLEIKDITEELTLGVRELVQFDRLTLVLFNAEEDAYDYIRASFVDKKTVRLVESQRSTLEGTAIGQSFNTKEVFIYHEGDADIDKFDDLRAWNDQGEASSIFLPLNAGGATLGVLHLGSDKTEAFDSEIRNLLVRTAQLVASTIQNARLFNQAVNLQILNRSVVESIQQGIVVLDNQGRIISINQFMKVTYAWDDSARGQDLFLYQPELADFLRDDLAFVLLEGEDRERMEQVSNNPAGKRIVRNFYIYPLRAGSQVRGAVLLVDDVTERTKLEEAIESRANQLAALTEVSTRITASLERDEVIQLAMDEMGFIIPFDAMSMWRRNGSFMVLDGATGYEDFQVEIGHRIRINDWRAIAALVESQRVIAVTEEDVPNMALTPQHSMQSWMGVPLVNQGHVVGMFILERKDLHAYDSRQEHNVAFAFASQVAIALANADLFEQTFERTNELGTLLEAARTTSLTRDIGEVFQAVAELMFGALEMEDATIMIWNEVDAELLVQYSGNRMGGTPRIPVGTRYNVNEMPARQQALRDRDVMVIIDVADPERQPPYPQELDDMRSSGLGARMFVPLVVRDQSIGMIQLDQHSNDEETLTQQKLRLARALGSQVAVAIENARLTQETTARFEELLTINQLSQSISSTLSLDAMLPIIREQVPQVTNAEELYLALFDAEKQMINFPLAVRGQKEAFVIPARPLADDEVSYIIKRKHALSLDDDYFSIDELRRSMKLTNGEGQIKSYMGVPLKSGDTILGVLAIRNISRKRAFNINDDRILTTVGAQLGAAIQNARLFEQIQRNAENLEKLVEERTDELEEERDRLDKLYQITSELARTLDMEQLLERSLGMVSKAVGADDGVIMLSDPATDNLYSRAWINPAHLIEIEEEDIRTHPAEGLAEWLIHEDDSGDNVVLVDDLNEMDYWDERGRATGLRSALAVMLENNEDPMGVMVLMSKEVGAFTENHLKLLVPAATQVAASINSADLYQLIRDQAERMGKLLRSEQEEAQKHSAILESIADGVLLADSRGNIVLFNTAAERILELPREQALGQPAAKLGGLYGASGVKWTQLMGEWSGSSDTVGDEIVTERLELGAKIIQTQLSPVYIGDLFLGTVSVFRDITRDVESDRAKSKFIENVSHEFRTPLTPIKGYTDLLLMMGAANMDEMQLGMIRTIKENTDRLAALVDDVLRVSKLDSGEDKLLMSLVDLKDLIPTVTEKFASEPKHAAKGLQLHLSIEDSVPSIRADRDKLVQVLSNVVDNAFNYTPKGGSITVSVKRMPDSPTVQIEVADTGVGIPEEFREAAWRRFERHDPTAVELDVAGTGLGLSLAKDLVRLHNGDIWFESEVGVGTTFFIRLPIEQPNFRTSTAEFPTVDENEAIAGD